MSAYIDPLTIMIAITAICLLYAAYDGIRALTPKQDDEPSPRKSWLNRHLSRDEVAYLLKHIAVYDAVSPISPTDYHNGTKYELEKHITSDLGRTFKISQADWFNVARAWYVTRGQPQSDRVERLRLRLELNI